MIILTENEDQLANQSGMVIKMWYTNIYVKYKRTDAQTYIVIMVYQKYIWTSIKEGCATRSLYASSGPKAEGVPSNNQRGRGS